VFFFPIPLFCIPAFQTGPQWRMLARRDRWKKGENQRGRRDSESGLLRSYG
jgi:hypothetical protein